MKPDRNLYAPPQARVADFNRAPRTKPPTIRWAVTALWVSYVLTFTHAAIVIGHRWWPPQEIVFIQLGSELFSAALIYFVSSGRYWACLIYAVRLGVRTVNVIRYLRSDWQDSYGLVLVTAISFVCQYVAMFWLFSEPGRRWFARSQVD